MLVRFAVALLLAAHPITVHDPRIDEASGIGLGIRSPGVYYVQNDSGDSARFFAIDRRTGRTRAAYHVPDAVNHDWEDLAVAPDAAGTPSVWLADIGDNDAVRSEVDLYRVDEPRVDMSAYGAERTTARPDVWRLRYPSGPVNAESIAVTPTGRAYVITKVDSGKSTVYEVPAHPDADRVQTLRKVGAISLPAHGGLVPAYLQRLATGAAISRDGKLLLVRTYTAAYLWHVHHDDVAAAVRTKPQHVSIPIQQQGEGVCFAGRSLVLDSEGPHMPIVTVALPHPSSMSPSGRSTTSSRAEEPTVAASPASASASLNGSAGSGNNSAPIVFALAVVAACVGYWRLRRRG